MVFQNREKNDSDLQNCSHGFEELVRCDDRRVWRVLLHSNDEREISHGEKLRYRSFACDRRSTGAPGAEVACASLKQKMSQNR